MSQPIDAASVLLARAEGSAEVLLVSRAINLRFMGGFVAFPGGKFHAADAGLAQPERGLTASHVTAVRELFEETGVLLARGGDGEWKQNGTDIERELRQGLLDERTLFGEVLDRLGLHLEAHDLQLAGRLVTPLFAPVRFDTAFFTAHLPPGQQPEVWPGELTAGEFASASAALARWRQGDFPLTPPTVSILESIEGRPIEELPGRLRPLLDQLDAGRMPAIWFAPGVLMIPLDCRGYPPTTHTNAFLVGTGPVYLVDPGSAEPAEQEKLFDALNGRRIDAIILTHHHPDHIGAATVCAQRYRVPVLAHPHTAELLRGKVTIDRFIDDGATLDLGEAPHGRGRWALEAIHTPGHAQGHLALWQPDYGLLFVADMLSTLSSVIITPKDGELRQYLESLKRLQQYPTRMLLPAHGPPTLRAAHVLAETLAHRAAREQQLLETLTEGPRTIDELVQELYRGYSQAVLKLASQQVHAGLIKLVQDGSVVREVERWRRT